MSASPPSSREGRRLRRQRFLDRISSIGASAQAAIPGLYAWSITVAPAAWSRGSPLFAKLASIVGVLALVTAPLVERAGGPLASASASASPSASASASPSAPEGVTEPLPTTFAALRRATGPTWARIWSVWGFVLSSAIVWALVPGALSSAKLDAVRGALGMLGWALFAFASAGPALRPDLEARARVVAGATLRPRSEIPGGDGGYVAAGVALALGMQAVGWGVVVPERAVLVRLVTIVCGMAVLGATTSIALARHATRIPASRRVKLRRALPWIIVLVLIGGSGLLLTTAR